VRRATPAASAERTAAVIAEVVAELLGRHEASAVGVGAAGFVDEASGTVVFAPNLAWRAEPLRAKVAGLVGLPVVVENDATASVWAEARYGAARGHRHVSACGKERGGRCRGRLTPRLHAPVQMENNEPTKLTAGRMR